MSTIKFTVVGICHLHDWLVTKVLTSPVAAADCSNVFGVNLVQLSKDQRLNEERYEVQCEVTSSETI